MMGTAMYVPEEFDFLIGCFWDGSLQRATSLDDWVSKAVRLLDAQKKAVVKPFIDELLISNLSDQELQRIWNEGGACYSFPDANELRRVLGVIRDKLAAE